MNHCLIEPQPLIVHRAPAEVLEPGIFFAAEGSVERGVVVSRCGAIHAFVPKRLFRDADATPPSLLPGSLAV